MTQYNNIESVREREREVSYCEDDDDDELMILMALCSENGSVQNLLVYSSAYNNNEKEWKRF